MALAWLACLPGSARAVMDINNRGPTLNAGNFAMRVTNVGILGNAFFGVSFDPSFEYPRGSGHECLKHADLWVGALDELGHGRVSGGPELEWRPTLDPSDHVLTGWQGQPGCQRGVDDDGDGKIDEEIFNGRDDDGDGEIDEDLGFPSDQVTAADFTDDQPAAINYGYPNGEVHHPFGLAVHQEAYAWALPDYNAIAGVQFTITNRGSSTLRQVVVGLLADLDSRGLDDPTGPTNDLIVYRTFHRAVSEGRSLIQVSGTGFGKPCVEVLDRTVPVVVDGAPGSGLPAVAVMGLGHTTDPLALLEPLAARDAARAPGAVSFRYSVFRQGLAPWQGGVPLIDEDRYAALAGRYPASAPGTPGDQVVLVACGPFASLAPGQSVELVAALCAAPNPDSLMAALGSAAFLYRGRTENRLPDTTSDNEWFVGETGKNGHESCIEPPAGVTFTTDPHCPEKFARNYGPGAVPITRDIPVLFEHGHCVWTDADCDECTGLNGAETVIRWLDPGSVPPPPRYHVAPGDREVRIAWDNQPEILINAGRVGASGYQFAGYRLYRVSNWRQRASEMPPPASWEQIAQFGADTLDGQRPLGAITDSTLDYDFILYGQKHYPIGRYTFVDTRVQDGFDYVYVPTTIARRATPAGELTRYDLVESPMIASIDSIVVPHVGARGSAGGVWVVPNPYRGGAAWDRPPVRGDPFGRHIDFMGLPRARSTIKVWTVAGDFVVQVDHDGRAGDGQAPWNLISRNGQDVESGIYLFTVDSPLGHQTGRFVIIR